MREAEDMEETAGYVRSALSDAGYKFDAQHTEAILLTLTATSVVLDGMTVSLSLDNDVVICVSSPDEGVKVAVVCEDAEDIVTAVPNREIKA